MASEVKPEKKEAATESKLKGLLKIAEVRMVLYIVPVVLVIFIVATLLKK